MKLACTLPDKQDNVYMTWKYITTQKSEGLTHNCGKYCFWKKIYRNIYKTKKISQLSCRIINNKYEGNTEEQLQVTENGDQLKTTKNQLWQFVEKTKFWERLQLFTGMQKYERKNSTLAGQTYRIQHEIIPLSV